MTFYSFLKCSSSAGASAESGWSAQQIPIDHGLCSSNQKITLRDKKVEKDRLCNCQEFIGLCRGKMCLYFLKYICYYYFFTGWKSALCSVYTTISPATNFRICKEGSYISFCDCHNKLLQTCWLTTTQTFVHQMWKPEVWNQGISRATLPPGAPGDNPSFVLPAYGGFRCFLTRACLTPLWLPHLPLFCVCRPSRPGNPDEDRSLSYRSICDYI